MSVRWSLQTERLKPSAQSGPTALLLREIQTEESETPAGAYARRQLFSLLLELQEQIKQELERSTAAEQRVVP
ncbi:hypothetical protein AK812_SmicGene18461 [Symbiodinium microadriaticum]|uniref:Uncharacterized protein n=1 Tax=Symbiodinium microadriaticum TaxID=2951 RepID=A0A1Q9DV32_SYMMI|nr:hypothetical protein AK812_SmicGene18461 [Symbiodinium microadriaticum]